MSRQACHVQSTRSSGTGRNLKISIIGHRADTNPEGIETTWSEFVRAFHNDRLDIREQKDGVAFIPATFGGDGNMKGSLRCAANVQTLDMLVLDLDGKVAVYDLDDIDRAVDGWTALVHTTYSHQPAAPRYRVILPLRQPLPPQRLKDLFVSFGARTGLNTDPACLNPDRAYYLPASPSDRVGYYRVVEKQGAWLDAEALLAQHTKSSAATVLPASPGSGPVSRADKSTTGKGRASIEKPSCLSSILASNSILALPTSSPRGSGTGPVTGKVLADYFKDFDDLKPVLAHLEIPVRQLGQSFLCVLPGHEEQNPSAVLVRDRQGRVVYRCFHRDGRFRVLGEVYASRFYGKPVEFGRQRKQPELATWNLRLLVDAGVLSPAPVPMATLDYADPALANLNPEKRRVLVSVHQGLRLLFRVKWLHSFGEPTTFSWRFAAVWCGVSQTGAARAMQHLLAMGLIHKVGEHRSAFGKKMALFLPGESSGGGSTHATASSGNPPVAMNC